MSEADTAGPDQSPSPTLPPTSWAIVELYGHRKLGGRITQVVVAGKSFFQVDVPKDDGFAPSIYNPNSFFGFHPVSEEIARAFAKRNPFRAVEDYELAPPETRRALPPHFGDTQDDDVDDDQDGDADADDRHQGEGSP